MNRSAPVLITLLSLLALAGCTTDPPYGCPLKDTGGCSSMQQVYSVARKTPPNVSSEQIMNASNSAPAAPHAAPAGAPYQPPAYAEPGNVGEPVFHQPKVYRVWIAPYVDADGNLRSGEITYFSTPGAWDYGTLDQSGEAGGSLFTPQQPGDLGFTPAPTAPKGAPPAPPSGLPTPSNATPVTTPQGITQPAVSLKP